MARRTPKSSKTAEGLSRITVSGFKSIREERSIEVRPLTVLAGANSSGKSSMIQPLLLLKQTLDATYDPGPLRLDGPNVRFTQAEQLMSKFKGRPEISQEMQFRLEAKGSAIGIVFERAANGLQIARWNAKLSRAVPEIDLASDLGSAQIERRMKRLKVEMPFFRDLGSEGASLHWSVERDRCFFRVLVSDKDTPTLGGPLRFQFSAHLSKLIQRCMHVPGLRGNPARTYPVTAVGTIFEGTFENYVASVIRQWESSDTDDDKEHLIVLKEDMEELGLTWKVGTRQLNDTQVELLVGRLPHASQGGAHDLVNVADVGFGVSQTLPVLVALIQAEAGQAVVVEQPEIHLHPRAQVAMAGVLARAARRGVRVIVETHSALLLTALQALVAEGEELSPEEVILHWFERDKTGQTYIRPAELDEAGAYGDWPEDFGEVLLDVQRRYLDAAEAKLLEVADG